MGSGKGEVTSREELSADRHRGGRKVREMESPKQTKKEKRRLGKRGRERVERSARHTHTCTCKSNGGPQGEGEGGERLRKENRKSGQRDIKPRHATHTVQAPMVTHKRRSEGREKCQCVRRGALKDTRVHAYACGLPSRGRGMGRSSHVVVHTSITLHTADLPPPRPHRLFFVCLGAQ